MHNIVIPTNTSYHSVLATKIPPTPGPRSIETIQADAQDRFAGILWINRDPSHSLEDYMIDCDHWEPYSEIKSYSKRPYSAAYKGIMREYHNLNSEQGDELYVISKRIRSELETYEEFCTCITCSAFFLNPLKYLWCPHCTQCIKAGPGFAKKEYIEKAIQLKTDSGSTVSSSKYYKYVKEIRWIKGVELATVSTIGLAILWSLIL
jgi:hypothetical protein